MATKIGTLVMMKIGTGILIGETSSSFTSTADAIEISSKATGRDSNFEYGRMNRTLSVSSIASTDPAATGYGFEDALAAQAAGTKVEFSLTEFSDKTGATPVAGATIVSGIALITNVAWENPDNDRITFSLDLQVDGTATVGVNS